MQLLRFVSFHLGDTTPGNTANSGSPGYRRNQHVALRDDFIALVPVYMEAVIRVAAALVGPADAEDAAQEAMVRGWQAWPTLRERGAVRAWLLRITVNVCKDWQRGRFGTQRLRSQPLHEEYLRGAASDGSWLAMIGLDPGGSDATMALDIRAALAALDEEPRIIVVLRYYAGMDSSAIGATLNLPAATVRTRLRRALVQLRTHLDSTTNTHSSSSSSSSQGGR